MTDSFATSYESIGPTSSSLLERVKAEDQDAWQRLVRLYRRLDDSTAEPRRIKNRSVRGGCYMDLPQFLRFAMRIKVKPTERMSNLGFRVVKEVADRS